ncbi:MAG: DUF882 domain-containing protein [Gammaproteobacteria bacterium]|nr:DUF882 domain-containing protein [Gammaproteobacteria bacterium]
MQRRVFLGLGAAALAGVGLSSVTPRAWASAAQGERRLALFNLHTQEHLNLVYWADGAYISENIDQIDHILRDFRTGEVAKINLRVLDYLNGISEKMALHEPLQIVSGYRSARTNDMLHRRDGDGVAKNSLHTRGMAVDIKLRHTSLENLHKAALATRRGGVGYYPEKFIHVDVGPVRQWRKKT